MPTVLEYVTGWMGHQARKHGLGDPEQYAREQVNQMEPYELLQQISEAIEEIRKEPT